MNRVLIIDDEPNSALALGLVLHDQGYEVRVERNALLALQSFREFKPNVVLIDSVMPKSEGCELAWQLCAEPGLNGTKLIIYSDVEAVALRQKLPPREIAILEKPVDLEELTQALRMVV